MSEQEWRAVDRFIEDRLLAPDPVLNSVLAANRAAGLPAIDVSPAHGKFLHLLARLIGARRILEIGTLGGYSTIWLARAVPDAGRVVTLEADARHAAVARANFARAEIAHPGLAGRIELREGPALDTLPALAAEAAGPFDLVFIDADKPNNPRYLEWALRLARPGGAIIGDNVVREGAILEPESGSATIRAIRSFYDLLGREPRLEATAIQTVGAKGWDGFALAIVA